MVFAGERQNVAEEIARFNGLDRQLAAVGSGSVDTDRAGGDIGDVTTQISLEKEDFTGAISPYRNTFRVQDGLMQAGGWIHFITTFVTYVTYIQYITRYNRL